MLFQPRSLIVMESYFAFELCVTFSLFRAGLPPSFFVMKQSKSDVLLFILFVIIPSLLAKNIPSARRQYFLWDNLVLSR